MVYAFIFVLLIAVGLGIGLYFQVKAGHAQADQQQQLLTDYQRRVDEQQKLLDDYRSLEKNFDSVGEGYEQALLSYEKMEEELQKLQKTNDSLQKRNESLNKELHALKSSAQQQADVMKQLVADVQTAAKSAADPKLAAAVARLSDVDDLQADLPPLERTDNILVAQVADEAIKDSSIDQAQYLKFACNVAPDAAATMLSTNLQKAVRSLTHLLDNAQKFTTEGTVTLTASVDMDKMQVIYAVEDSGSGVAAADAERIFEPYVKLNQYFGGQGIGLTVARNLARRLGGDVTFDTAFAGPGSRFVLTLPM
jgi:signal transduction histidine kinase